jgi:hypothetical protein
LPGSQVGVDKEVDELRAALAVKEVEQAVSERDF